MLVAGVDGCRAGWVVFKLEVSSFTTSVEVVNLPTWLRERPPDLACVGIDIPIGLLEGPRAFDSAARKLLGRPRGSGADDLLDAAAAAWTALRWYRNEAECVCTLEHDEKGLAATIYY